MGTHAIMSIFTPSEPARWDKSNGLWNAAIAPKLAALPPKMQMVGERLGWARGFQYWSYHIVLYTIGTGSMRRFQWYRAGFDSTKTYGATPKYGNSEGKA